MIFIRSDKATNIPYNVGWRKFVFIRNIILNEMYYRTDRIWLSCPGKKGEKKFFFFKFPSFMIKRENIHEWGKYPDCESTFKDQFVTRPYSITSDQINLDISLSISCDFCYSPKESRPVLQLPNKPYFYDEYVLARVKVSVQSLCGAWVGHVYYKQKWK